MLNKRSIFGSNGSEKYVGSRPSRRVLTWTGELPPAFLDDDILKYLLSHTALAAFCADLYARNLFKLYQLQGLSAQQLFREVELTFREKRLVEETLKGAGLAFAGVGR